MEEKAIRGVPWALLSYASTRLTLLLTTIVLARLLVPSDFGLLALGMVAIALLNTISDLGLSATLVLRRDLDLHAQGTVLTMMLGASVGLAVAITVAAPAIAAFFDEPRLDGVLAALSVGVVIAGMTTFYDALLQRELEFRRRFACLIAQSIALAFVSITLAALGAGVWSLVVGQVAALVVFGIVQLALAPYRVRPRFDRGEAANVLDTSWGFLGQTGLVFVSENVDYLAVGRTMGANQVGFYSMAFRLSEIPIQGIADPVNRVTFSGFSRMRHRGESVTSAFLTSLALVALVACPLGALLSATADPFTRAIFGDNWLPMIGPLAVLGIYGAIRPMQATVRWMLNSVGQARIEAVAMAIMIVPLIPALFIAADGGGITTVAWVMVADVVISVLVLSILVKRRAGVPVTDQWGAVAPVVAGCVPAWIAARAVAEAAGSAAPGVALTVAVAAGACAYGAALLLIAPGLPREALRQARHALSSEAEPTEEEVPHPEAGG